MALYILLASYCTGQNVIVLCVPLIIIKKNYKVRLALYMLLVPYLTKLFAMSATETNMCLVTSLLTNPASLLNIYYFIMGHLGPVS